MVHSFIPSDTCVRVECDGERAARSVLPFMLFLCSYALRECISTPKRLIKSHIFE